MASNTDANDWRITRKRIEKRECPRVQYSLGVLAHHPRDRPRRHRGDQQLVTFPCRDFLEVEKHDEKSSHFRTAGIAYNRIGARTMLYPDDCGNLPKGFDMSDYDGCNPAINLADRRGAKR